MKWYEEAAKRQTRNATWLAMLISGLYLIYNLQDFRSAVGRVVARHYGYSIEIFITLLLSSIGLFALNTAKKSGIFWLLLGGAMLYYLSPLAFMITLPVPLTWMIARLVFKHYPTKTIWIFIIPLFTCFGGWIGEQYFTEAIRQAISSSKKEVIQTPFGLSRATVIAPEGARLRSGPSTRSATIGTIGAGEVITILEQKSGWYKVQHEKAGQSLIGYLYHTLAQIKGTAPLSPAPFVTEEKAISPPTSVNNSTPSDGSTGSSDQLLQEPDFRQSEDVESLNLDSALPSGHSLIGRWEGNLGEQVLLLAIEYFEGNQWLGYSEVRWQGSSPELRMELQGRLNPETLEVTFLQKQKGSLVGTFNGTIASDGDSMKGIWKFEEDPSQKYNWLVRRSTNVIH